MVMSISSMVEEHWAKLTQPRGGRIAPPPIDPQEQRVVRLRDDRSAGRRVIHDWRSPGSAWSTRHPTTARRPDRCLTTRGTRCRYPTEPGPDNDLADELDHYVERAIADPAARAYAFGQRWGPEPSTPDKVFGFTPGNGVHDVHMNQGNSAKFQHDDGVWQDGGLLLHYPPQGQWVAVFLAFPSQAWHTDDQTGHAIPGIEPAQVGQAVRIVAALANPPGPAPEAETVTLLNASPQPVDLAGWSILDREKRRMVLGPGLVPAGDAIRIPVVPPVQLGNRGGLVTLLDPDGLKIDGVAYTKAQADAEGWTITF